MLSLAVGSLGGKLGSTEIISPGRSPSADAIPQPISLVCVVL